VLAVAVPGVVWNLAIGMLAGLALHLGLLAVRRRRRGEEEAA
jgi:hypothetical protein